MIKEILKIYRVNCRGDILKIKTNKVMTQSVCKKGYHRVFLTVNGKRISIGVHRVVALAFVSGKTRWRNEVNHIDGNKSNNTIKNLEWVTRKENMKHGLEVIKTINKPRNELRDKMIVELRKTFGRDDVANVFGVAPENITRICNLSYQDIQNT
jgi:hypothetical protein